MMKPGVSYKLPKLNTVLHVEIIIVTKSMKLQ